LRPFLPVVVDDLDVVRATLRPAQADPPLVVDADAVLARAVPAQGFEAVAGRRLEVAERSGMVDLQQIAMGDSHHVRRDALRVAAIPRGACGRVAEGFDHAPILTPSVMPSAP